MNKIFNKIHFKDNESKITCISVVLGVLILLLVLKGLSLYMLFATIMAIPLTLVGLKLSEEIDSSNHQLSPGIILMIGLFLFNMIVMDLVGSSSSNFNVMSFISGMNIFVLSISFGVILRSWLSDDITQSYRPDFGGIVVIPDFSNKDIDLKLGKKPVIPCFIGKK